LFFFVEALTEDTDIPNPREHMAITRIQARQKSSFDPLKMADKLLRPGGRMAIGGPNLLNLR
jgi:hypothetical protein